MGRQVRGSLFLDYVRMLRARKGVDWSSHLAPEDMGFLGERIDVDAWYPMATFERLGLAILAILADGDPEAVRLWGRLAAPGLAGLYPNLLVPGDPRESLMRFHVLRRTFFDFEAASVTRLDDAEVRLRVAYGMSPTAEEAAACQTLGFLEGFVELAGGSEVKARFADEAWRGAPATTLVVSWRPPARLG